MGAFYLTPGIYGASGSGSGGGGTDLSNRSPSFEEQIPPKGIVNTPYEWKVKVGGKEPLTLSLGYGGSLPSGLSIQELSIVGTPTIESSANITLNVRNDLGIAESDFNITIEAPPTITTTSLPEGRLNSAYNGMIIVDGTYPITVSTNSTLPAGISFNKNTNKLEGMPTVIGEFPIKFDAVNSIGSTSKILTLKIIDGTPVPTWDQNMRNIPINTAYTSQLTATGPTPLTWAIEKGNLPTGLALDSNGAVSGTPTTAGTYTCEIKVSNAYGQAIGYFEATVS